MVSWLYKAAFLSPSLSLSLWVSSWSSIGFCRVHLTHHIWFALVKFLCVLWTPFWLCYLWPCQAVAQLVKSCYPSPPHSISPFPTVCAFYGHQNSGAAAFDMRLRCGPRKSFHFNFFIFFFAFHFSVFGFFFSHFFLSHSLCCPIGNCQTGRGGCEGDEGQQKWTQCDPKNKSEFSQIKLQIYEAREREEDKERPELPTLALG